MVDDNLQLRPAGPADLGFVLNSWLKCLANKKCPDFHGCPHEIFYPRMESLAKHLLTVKECYCVVTTHDPAYIVGWVCFERLGEGLNVIHFAYVKQVYRRMGILRSMVDGLNLSDGLMFTQRGTYGIDVAPRLNAVFNPFLLMR